MSLRSEVRELLVVLREREDTVQILERQIAALRSDNRNLLDRLMAKNYETLQTYSLPRKEEEPLELLPQENEDMAGEVLSVKN